MFVFLCLCLCRGCSHLLMLMLCLCLCLCASENQPSSSTSTNSQFVPRLNSFSANFRFFHLSEALQVAKKIASFITSDFLWYFLIHVTRDNFKSNIVVATVSYTRRFLNQHYPRYQHLRGAFWYDVASKVNGDGFT